MSFVCNDLSDWTRGTARSRNLQKRACQARTKNNGSSVIPGCPKQRRSIAYGLQGAAAGIDSFQLTSGEETYLTAVAGPKRESCTIGLVQLLACTGSQRPNPQFVDAIVSSRY